MCFMFFDEIIMGGKHAEDRGLRIFALCVLRAFDLCMGDAITATKSCAEVEKSLIALMKESF